LQRKKEQLYYKPHFGPEETDDMLKALHQDKIKTKSQLKNELQTQIRTKHDFKYSREL